MALPDQAARFASLKASLQVGVSVADTGDVFAGGTVFKSKSSFVNHLSSAGSNNVRAQKSVCCLLTEDLDQPVCVVVALGSAVRGKGELANVVGDALGLQLFLVLAHPGHLRVSVDHTRNTVVVNVHWASDHSLTADDSLVLGLVCKHRSLDDVADGIDVGEDSLESGVNRHPASVVPLNANIFKT